MDILGVLFGSPNRVKVMRLFFLNPEEVFSNTEISQRSKVKAPSLRREISVLSRIGFIKKKSISGKKKAKGWQLDSSFPYLSALKNLILKAAPISKEALLKKIKGAGRLKLIVVAGIFTGDDNSRADLLLVGDALRKNKIEKIIKDIEASVGKELEYAFFDTLEFKYRLGMYDKFIRDILDYSHEKILDKLGI
jgi:hypothetical protein